MKLLVEYQLRIQLHYEFRFWAENDRFMNRPARIKLQKTKDFDG